MIIASKRWHALKIYRKPRVIFPPMTSFPFQAPASGRNSRLLVINWPNIVSQCDRRRSTRDWWKRQQILIKRLWYPRNCEGCWGSLFQICKIAKVDIRMSLVRCALTARTISQRKLWISGILTTRTAFGLLQKSNVIYPIIKPHN